MKLYLQAILLLSAALMMLVGQVNAQSMPSVEDEETPIFNFPRQIGNVWVYEWQSNCRGEKACAVLRKELIDEIEVDGMSCSVFELNQASRTMTWCFEDNKIYWPRTDFDPSTDRVDLIADFGQEPGASWLLSSVIDPNHQSYIVVEFWGIEEFGPTYTFSMYGTDNLETLEPNVLLKFVDDQIPLIGYSLYFENDLGLEFYYGSLDGGPGTRLKGSYINGELVGDTTFYYATSIDFEPGLPSEFELGAYPNPFNPTTQIQFTLPMESHVELGVYTVTGRLITTLVNEVRPAGTHQVTFDASGMSSGIYIYRIRAGDFIQTSKMTLVK